MEKSIESIWQEGFLNKDALVAPKVNKLYEQKSKHLVDTYKRMFKNNMILLSIGSVVLMIISLFIGIPYFGVSILLILNAMVLVDSQLLQKLNLIDNTLSSYQYLLSLKNWVKHKNKINIIMARFFYPYAFVAFMLGAWYFSFEGRTMGERIVSKLLAHFPSTELILGFPVYGIIAVAIFAGVLALLGGQIYKWDLSLVYGNILQKLDDLIADMEELRK